MTGEMMNLKGLVEKAPDADVLREMISFAASRLMELEVSALTGAPYGEKDPECACARRRTLSTKADTAKRDAWRDV
jgi:putative transposase